MSARDNGGPAFPRDHASDGHNGMSLRDYFAAMAPTEIPRWFAFGDALPQLPSILPIHQALEQQAGYAALSYQEKEIVNVWLHDMSWDLDDANLAVIGQAADIAIRQSRLDRASAEDQREAAHYFAWRWHYADAMLKARKQ